MVLRMEDFLEFTEKSDFQRGEVQSNYNKSIMAAQKCKKNVGLIFLHFWTSDNPKLKKIKFIKTLTSSRP